MSTIDEYRRKDIESIIRSIEGDSSKYIRLMEEKKKLGKLCTKLDLVATVAGVVITLVFSILGSNEVINPKIAIAVMEALFSAVAGIMLLITRMGNIQNKKYYVYEKIKKFSLEQLNHFKMLYSSIFEDGEISKDDYDAVIKFKNDYDHKKVFIKTELGNGYTKINNN